METQYTPNTLHMKQAFDTLHDAVNEATAIDVSQMLGELYSDYLLYLSMMQEAIDLIKAGKSDDAIDYLSISKIATTASNHFYAIKVAVRIAAAADTVDKITNLSKL